VGKLLHNKYSLYGKSFSLPQHGFARDRLFQLVEQTTDTLRMRLEWDEASLKVFPYRFHLEVWYILRGKALEVSLRVFHTNTEPMYFSLGGHPGFTCPLYPGESFEDYYLEFPHKETAPRHLLSDGLRSGATEPCLVDSQRLPLVAELFEKDAIVLSDLVSRKVQLCSSSRGPVLEMRFPNSYLFGIWTKPGAPFICLEPWQGWADSVDSTGNFLQKDHQTVLQPGRVHAFDYDIEVLS
jgi:galactose mutarotase-like enzyme